MKRFGVSAVVALVSVALAMVTVVGAGAQTTTPVQVNDVGVGKPPPGTGLGTKAALDNPKCTADAVKGWGVFSFVNVTTGPFCVAPAPADNGGATARGVTATSIKVVVVVPSAAALAAGKAAGAVAPVNQATGEPGTIEDAFRDGWAAYEHVYETWGRKVDLTFMTSSGADEAAQRADAVAVEQEKPMFVIDATSTGLGTLANVLGKDKYVVLSYATTTKDAASQAPYRWGNSDPNAIATNVAQFIGAQLAKGKAEYAGDSAMQSQPRKFGAVIPGNIDTPAFLAALKKQGVTLATPPLDYTANGSPLGDPVTAQTEAPLIVAKLKSAGITSVILFTDIGMTGALTKVAATQEYRPEWVMTGYGYQDISLLARTSYDQDEWSHAFGIGNLTPVVRSANIAKTIPDWYWGPKTSTTDPVTGNIVGWLAAAIQYAGPDLTPQNVQRGFFAVPAEYGAASDDPGTIQVAWGKTAGLPVPSYFTRGSDFAAVWYDAKTKGESQVYPTVGEGVTWFTDNGKRYAAGTWPKKKIEFFKKAGSIYAFDAPPVPLAPVIPCEGCPSSGGPGKPSAASSN